jgi:YesN/AraC family two-component response regulator
MIVKAELEKLGIHYKTVGLGEILLTKKLTEEKHDKLKSALLESGLELMDDKRSIIIEKIKTVIIEMIYFNDELPSTNYSTYISEKLQYDYTYLANLFSDVQGITIEHYIIANKIERVKEFLIMDELNLTQISYKMHYSSVAHLSNQFKKVTGFTPTFYKNMKHKKRIDLENL